MTAGDSYDRIDDDDYPAYTMVRAAEMLGTTQGFLRSIGEAGLITPLRSEGGHRRYSRYQLRIAARARELVGHGVLAVRGLGLWAGVDIDPALGTGKELSMRLADHGVLVKDTHGSTLRFAPPLVIAEQEIDWAVRQFATVLREAG